MARYQHTDMSPRLLPVDLQTQLVWESFAHALHHLADQLDLRAFDAPPYQVPVPISRSPAAPKALAIRFSGRSTRCGWFA